MDTINRPNRQALSAALDIYRDEMRPFIVRNLRRIRGTNADDAIKSALRDGQYNQFTANRRNGLGVGASIDIGDFPQVVRRHWQTFRDAFKTTDDPRDIMRRLVDARNEVAHPGDEDIDLDNAVNRLNDTAAILRGINSPEQGDAVKAIRNDLIPLYKVPAHKFQQGGRDVYAFPLDLESLNKILPHRVDDRMVKDANRRLSASHAKDIQVYLEGKDDWLLGTLLLGVAPDAIDFQPYTSGDNSETSVGALTINADGASSMKMFDGQHRRRAISAVLNELSHNARYSTKFRALKDASLPIMLYAEVDMNALQQMFADAAQTKPIEANAVAQFDQRDAFNIAALRIAEESELFNGRVEMDRPSVPRSSHKIIAINQLSRTLKTLEVGYSGRVSKERNELYMLDIEDLCQRSLEWADDFMPSIRSEYNDLKGGEIGDVPAERTKTMAYNAIIIRIFAGCYHEWTKDGSDWEPLAKFINCISLSPGISEGLLVDAGAVAHGGTSPVAAQQAGVKAIDYILEQARQSGS